MDEKFMDLALEEARKVFMRIGVIVLQDTNVYVTARLYKWEKYLWGVFLSEMVLWSLRDII
jgi:hypothetical protein